MALQAKGGLRNIAQWLDDRLRHQSVLGTHRWLRGLLRRPYHGMLDFLASGLHIELGGCISARVPAAFRSKLMEQHECEQFKCLADWCRQHPGGLVVDIGCSIGYMSCAALFASNSVNVIAVDPDESSLLAARELCRYAPGHRLHLVHGFIGETHANGLNWRTAEHRTTQHLRQSRASGDPRNHKYIYLNDPQAGRTLRIYSLDGLFSDAEAENGSVLIKCDAEGAEYNVLRGASELVKSLQPVWLLSVHQKHLSDLGHTRQEVEDVLRSWNYRIKILAVDHEEHWLCEPPPPAG
jgi:FkbM family methyltransferase